MRHVVQFKLSDSASVSPTTDALFGGCGWLSEASCDLRAHLRGAARSITYARNERLFAAGDPVGGIYGVVSGGIGVEASGGGHAVRMSHVVRPGFWLGHGPALGADSRTLGFVAIEESEVALLPLPLLKKIMHQDDELRSLLGNLANMAAEIGKSAVSDLLIPDAPRRISAVLLRVTGALYGVTPSHPHGFPLTQTLIGELANASRSHVNRVLAQLSDLGLITKHYNFVKVIDPEGLARFAHHEE